ncbi:MAG TPA: NAD(P)-dependent alcohol dehydrogenase [Candidatus Faecousia excrementigallinarum]|uniref:NAD(P)-dependent alcohol dehydrogenase n=1 Tax=Candidatus Faecousia excrementigallinarum TaxID=2840806 RepID=A0A9D0Z3Y5_9FIRM|nr:NAD(P)-dependent alcohol dehydrogenase [Candidatus Faecousia excrementigallinarum]
MKGFAMRKIGSTGWVEKERPQCGPLDAICRPLALAPCTSDIHTVWAGAIGDRKDMILGHEAVGEVVEVGALVKDFKPGDRVIITAITPDWSTLEAQGGFPMHSGGMLSGWKFSNFKDGVFAEYFHVNDADGNLAHLPEGMDLGAATMLADMVPTGLHGAELADITFGDNVAVIGIGPVGLMAVAGAALRGAAQIYAVGSRKNCADLALEFGATRIVNYREGDIVEQILDLTRGQGVDKVIVAGGDNNTFTQALKILKPGGIIGNVNYLGEGESVPISRLDWGCGMGHKQIRGGLMPGGRLRAEKLARLVTAGRIHPEKLITHTFHGLENVEPALMLMKDKPRDLIKPLVILD